MFKKLSIVLILSISIFSLIAQQDSRYDASMNLPFNQKAGDVNPQTGSISVGQTDVSLPGRAGVNFSFGRSWTINQASVYDMSYDNQIGENVLSQNALAAAHNMGIGWSSNIPYILKDTSSGQLVVTLFLGGSAFELNQDGIDQSYSAGRSNILGYDLLDKQVYRSGEVSYSHFTGLDAGALALYGVSTSSEQSRYALRLTDNSKYFFREDGKLMMYQDKTKLNTIWYFYNSSDQLALVYDAIGREIAFEYDSYGNLTRISYDVSKGTKDGDGNRSRVTEERFVAYEYEEIPANELPDISAHVRGSNDPIFRLIAVSYPEDVRIEYDYEVKPFLFSFDRDTQITNYSNLLTGVSNNVKDILLDDGSSERRYSSRREFFYDTPNGENYSKPLFNGTMEYFKISKQQMYNRRKVLQVPTYYRYYTKAQTDVSGSYSAEVETANLTMRYMYKEDGTAGDHVLLYIETRSRDGFVEKTENSYDNNRALSGSTVYRNGTRVYFETYKYNKKGQLLHATDKMGLWSETRYHETFGIPIYQRVYIKSEDQEIVTEHEIDAVRGWLLKSYLHVGAGTDKRRITVQEMVYDEYGNVVQQIDTDKNVVHFEYDTAYNAFPVKTYTNVRLRDYSGARSFADNWTETPDPYSIKKAQKFMVFNSDGTVWIEVDNDGYGIEHYYDALGAEIETVIPDADDNPAALFDSSITEFEGCPYWIAFLEERKNNPGTRIFIDRTNALNRQMSDIDRANNIYQKAGQQGDGLGNAEADIVYYGSADYDDWREYSSSTATYDTLGRLVAITDADAGSAYSTISLSDGTVIHKYDKTWLIAYDDLGRQKRVQYPNTRGINDVKTFDYNDVENSVTIIDAENRRVYSQSDWNGNVIKTIAYGDYKTAESDVQTYSNRYDEAGRLQLSTDPEGYKTGYDYDERNLLIRQWYSTASNADEMVYDDRSLLIRKTDRKGQVLEFTYDELGRAIKVDHFTAASASTPVRTVQSDFDRRGNVIRVASDALTEYYEYDHGSRVTRLNRHVRVDGLADTVNPVWQGADDMIFSFEYQYSEGGLVQQMVYPDGAVHQYDYDTEFARLTAIQEGIDTGNIAPFVEKISYNLSGIVTDMQWANGTRQSWTFDNRKRISELAVFNAAGLIERNRYTLNGNGDITNINNNEYTYDGFNRIIGAHTELPASQTINLTQLVDDAFGTYADAPGTEYNPVADVYPLNDPDGRINGADAMQAYQLMKEVNTDDLFDVEAFTYDRNGNRTRLDQNGDVYRYVYGDRNRLKAIYLTKKDSGVESKFAEYTYDENGNTTKRVIYRGIETETITFTFDTLNRLIRTDKFIAAENPENNNSRYDEYYYDNAGNRFVKRSSTGETTLYLRHGQLSVAMDIEIPDRNETEYLGKINRYVLSGDLLAGRVTTTITEASNAGTEDATVAKSYYHLDHLNSTKIVTDETGEIEVNYIYRAFGEELKKLGEVDAGYTYGGKELDDSTNLYYFNARFYDATIGRFINADPMQDGANWYVYCLNNPLNMKDPTGLFFIWVQGEGVSDEDFEAAKAQAEEIMNSDTEAGRRMKAMHNASKYDFIAIINVNATGGNYADAENYDNAVSGAGSNTVVELNINEPGLGAGTHDEKKICTMVHEISGHAWDDFTGRGPYWTKYRNNYDRQLSEQNAMAMENEFRSFLGIEQSSTYAGLWDVPIYQKDTNSFLIYPGHIYKTNDNKVGYQRDADYMIPWTMNEFNDSYRYAKILLQEKNLGYSPLARLKGNY